MRTRLAFGKMAALIAAATILVGSPRSATGQVVPKKAAAQDTSAKRIKVTKQLTGKQGVAGGEIELPLKTAITRATIDSAAAAERAAGYAREKLARDAQWRLDSIAAELRVRREVMNAQRDAAAARERERQDSIAFADRRERDDALALKRHLARGFYFGIAGGASTPQRDLRNGYAGGWNTTVPVGWDHSDSPFGVRGDFSIDHLNGTRIHDVMETTTAASGDITVWSLNTDVKVRMHAPGAPSRTNVYALGGFGAHRVVNGVYGVTGPNAGHDLSFNDGKTSFGWNVGAGLSIPWGPAEVFVESRFFHVKSDLAFHSNGGVGTYTSFTPIVVGLQWF